VEMGNRFAHDTVDDLMEHLVVDDGAFDFESHNNRPPKRVKQSAMLELLEMLKHIDKDGRRISYNSKEFLEHVASVKEADFEPEMFGMMNKYQEMYEERKRNRTPPVKKKTKPPIHMSMDATAGGAAYMDDDDVEMLPHRNREEAGGIWSSKRSTEQRQRRNRGRHSPSLTPLSDSESGPDYDTNAIAASYQADRFPGATPQTRFDLDTPEVGTPVKRKPREIPEEVHSPVSSRGGSTVSTPKRDPKAPTEGHSRVVSTIELEQVDIPPRISDFLEKRKLGGADIGGIEFSDSEISRRLPVVNSKKEGIHPV